MGQLSIDSRSAWPPKKRQLEQACFHQLHDGIFKMQPGLLWQVGVWTMLWVQGPQKMMPVPPSNAPRLPLFQHPHKLFLNRGIRAANRKRMTGDAWIGPPN
jgi:hypothetical protein